MHFFSARLTVHLTNYLYNLIKEKCLNVLPLPTPTKKTPPLDLTREETLLLYIYQTIGSPPELSDKVSVCLLRKGHHLLLVRVLFR